MPPSAASSPRSAILLLSALVFLSAGGCASAPSGSEAHSFATVHQRDGVQVEQRWTFYEVRGRSAAEVARSLASEAPPHGDYRVYGQTRWTARWDYDLRPSSVDCRIVRPRVELEIETVLPRWPERGQVDPELRERWKAFVEAVRSHEIGHRELVEEAGRRIVTKLAGLRELSCEVLAVKADVRARSVVADYHHRNLSYDERTGGGREQGVRWP